MKNLMKFSEFRNQLNTLSEARASRVKTLVGILKNNAAVLGISIDKTDHLRLKCPNRDYVGTLQKVLPVPFDIKKSNKGFSRTYDDYLVTIKDDYEDYPAGSTFYYVPAIRKDNKSFITDKQLTPERVLIDLTKEFDQKSLYNLAYKNIDVIIDEDLGFIKTFLRNMLDYSIGRNVKLSLDNITETDLTRILKDFGEIACALNTLATNKDIKYIKFPTKSNEPLVDFYGLNSKKEIVVNYSVKSGTNEKNIGAAPSMKNIAQYIDDYSNPKMRIFEIFTSSVPVVQKIIDAALLLDPKAVDLIKRVIKKDVTISNISDYCKNNIYTLKIDFAEFYNHIGKTFDDESIQKALTKNLKNYSGFVLSPLGYRIRDLLNDDKEYVSIINSILRKIEVTQANVVWKNGLKFSYEHFKDVKGFAFDFHNNVLLPGNNNFGFKVTH